MSLVPRPSVPVTAPWAHAFQQVYADLVRQLSRRTGHADTARDLAHDTWLRLAEGDTAQAQNLPAYVIGTARNLAVDQQRR